MSKESEEQELNQLLSLFQESPEEIKDRKVQLKKALAQANDFEFPTQISAITALDELFGCFALGGQVKNYYRYGTYDKCQKQREKFWFAIKNGSILETKDNRPLEQLSEREIDKRVKIQDFYKKRWIHEKAVGSSEDIWNERKDKLDSPFKGKFN